MQSFTLQNLGQLQSRRPTEHVSFGPFENGFCITKKKWVEVKEDAPVLKFPPYSLPSTRVWERKGEKGSLSSQEAEKLCYVAGSTNTQEEESLLVWFPSRTQAGISPCVVSCTCSMADHGPQVSRALSTDHIRNKITLRFTANCCLLMRKSLLHKNSQCLPTVVFQKQ